MLKNKVNGKKGFTLAELLIVVAIIGILVAISMPILTSRLNDARTNTNEANERAAKAVAVAEFLGETKTAGTYYFDADAGVLKKESEKSTITAYGQGSEKGNIIKITLDSAGKVDIDWVAPTP